MKLDILAIGAHPDDVELGCGGVIAKEAAMGKKIGIIDLTQGELGTRGTAKTRNQESEAAATILKVVIRENMKFADGFFINDKAHQLALIKKIRQYQPDIVLCNAIDDRHIDHPKGSKLVSNACFLSGLVKIETTSDTGILQQPWRPKHVYHYIQWKHIEPDFVVDIGNYIQVKKSAVLAYKTQFYDKSSTAPETPISTKNFTDSVIYRARDLGRLIGVDYAEGFTTERPVGVSRICDLK